MMRKKFIILVILVAVLFLMPGPVFAKSLFYAANPSSVAVASGTTLNAGTALVTGQCNVQSVTVSHGATAGDYLLLYDAASATGTPKYDIEVGTNTTVHIPLHDAEFGTGVFAKAEGQTIPALRMHVSLEYTQ